MIGGRVFDVTAIVDFATARSVYAEALVMTAIEENIVLGRPRRGTDSRGRADSHWSRTRRGRSAWLAVHRRRGSGRYAGASSRRATATVRSTRS